MHELELGRLGRVARRGPPTLIRPLAACLFVALPFAVAAQTATTSDAPLDTPDVTVSGGIDSAAKTGEDTKSQDDPQRQKQIYIQTPTDEGESEERPWWWWLRPVADAATVISTLILAGAGIYGLRFLRAQVAAMEESNRQTQKSNDLTAASLEHSQRTFETTQRARLVVAGYDNSVDQLEATAYITNTGFLPATEVRWEVFVTIAPVSAAIIPYIERPLASVDRKDGRGVGDDLRSVIGAGQELAIKPRWAHAAPRFEDEEGNLIGGMRIFAGRVEYLDGFGNNRVLTFCQFQDVGSEKWYPCMNCNRAD